MQYGIHLAEDRNSMYIITLVLRVQTLLTGIK